MTNLFPFAFNWVVNREGGYENDPRDPGGETKYGIDKRSYPSLDIKNLTIETAREVYSAIWNGNKCGVMPAGIAFFHFDCCVNQGSHAATRMLQSAVREQRNIFVDGLIGVQTVAALAAMDNEQLARLLRDYCRARVQRYFTTAAYRIYGGGWINRVLECYSGACMINNGVDLAVEKLNV